MLNIEHLLMTSDIVLILGGAMMYWLSPRFRRNWVFGYGSPRSMINDATWQAANKFAGLTLALLALVAMSLQVLLREAISNNDLGLAISAASVLAPPFLVMYLTEKHLERLFRI
jgi:uncharacterized membrane protein